MEEVAGEEGRTGRVAYRMLRTACRKLAAVAEGHRVFVWRVELVERRSTAPNSRILKKTVRIASLKIIVVEQSRTLKANVVHTICPIKHLQGYFACCLMDVPELRYSLYTFQDLPPDDCRFRKTRAKKQHVAL